MDDKIKVKSGEENRETKPADIFPLLIAFVLLVVFFAYTFLFDGYGQGGILSYFSDQSSYTAQKSVLKGVLIYLIVFPFMLVISQILGYFYAKNHNEKVFQFFSKRWLPTKGSNKKTISNDDKFVGVWLGSRWAKVIWILVTKSGPKTFFTSVVISLILLATLLIFARLSLIWGLLISALLTTLYSFLSISISYWLLEWERLVKRCVVFTTKIFVVIVETRKFHLISGGPMVRASVTKFIDMKEIENSTDPEMLKKIGIKTSKFHDWFITLREDILSIYLPSHREGAGDLLLWMEDGYALSNLFEKLHEKSIKIQKQRDYISEKEIELFLGEPSDKNWSVAKGRQAVDDFMSRIPSIGERKFDVYWDEGFQDDMSVVNIDQAVVFDEELENVLDYFSPINPLRR
ncbi:hypothetical protein K0B04_04035 [Patescibacteria group bacterium]|nr:hypothetical protein [Patescibacteria group bacterium]